MPKNKKTKNRRGNAKKDDSDSDIHLYTQLHNQPGQSYNHQVAQNTGHTQIYRSFSEAKEYHLSWLDPNTQKLKIEGGEVPVVKDWTDVNVTLKSSFFYKIKNLFALFFYVLIYAIIMFFIKDRGTGFVNAAF